MESTLEHLIRAANKGDRKALEQVMMEIKDQVYNLALKMLLFPEDAQDATQEILVKVVTHLSTFKGSSKFTTWVYRIATNYLITAKGKQSAGFAMSIDAYGELVEKGRSEEVTYAKNEGELRLLEEEVKVSCTHGLLLCLNTQSRMIYILSDVLEFNSLEGAEILDISPENFRKQLSRARTKIRNFLNNKCGLANPSNPCRCTKKIDSLVNQGLIDPNKLRFAPHTQRSIALVDQIRDMEKDVAIYRSTPVVPTPNFVVEKMKQTILKIS